MSRALRALTALAALQPCLACGNSPADGVGVYVPAVQPQRGRTRLVAYPLCGLCHATVTGDELDKLLERRAA